MSRPPKGNFKEQWVSASEIGSHFFCARSAWLSHSGATRGETARLDSGTRAHAGREVEYRAQIAMGRAGRWLVAAGLVALVAFQHAYTIVAFPGKEDGVI